jgi:hypothetical protein
MGDSCTELEKKMVDCLAQERMVIPYRPELAKHLKSINSAILLQQIIFRWIGNGRRPFYKFKEPCRHSKYRPGDSWVEELGFSRREFDTALRNIATWKKSGVSMSDAKKAGKPVVYWRTRDVCIFYTVNVPAVLNLFKAVYGETNRQVAAPSKKTGSQLAVPAGQSPAHTRRKNGSRRQKSPARRNIPPQHRGEKMDNSVQPLRIAQGVGAAVVDHGHVVDKKKSDTAAKENGVKAESAFTDIKIQAGPTLAPKVLKAESADGVMAETAVAIKAPDADRYTEKTKQKLSDKEMFLFWEMVKADLVMQMPADTYDFLMPYLQASLEDNSLVIAGPPASISWIEKQYMWLFSRTAAFVAKCAGLVPPEVVLRKRAHNL